MRLAAISLMVLAVAGCGSTDDDSTATPTAPAPAATPAAPAATPESCLTDAGLSNVEKRDVDLWRADSVRVSKFESEAEAERAVTDATDVWAAQAEIYAVFGPGKDVSDGGVVDEVAACLKG